MYPGMDEFPVGAVETEEVGLEVEAVETEEAGLEVEAVAGTQVKGDSEETLLMAPTGGPLSSSLRSSSGCPALSWREWMTAAAISNVEGTAGAGGAELECISVWIVKAWMEWESVKTVARDSGHRFHKHKDEWH
ncbi:hypothetical protein B0H14DRAFT_2633107 [Mycena olivaceomarginata]|nr:hypothetical protein B0H14DRAFT_2633107 [Mycena olivaceomarginata]